jgi:hypothetical protein
MDDPTGLGTVVESVAKIADSQLAIKAYDDLLADAMKEGGKALADVIKGLRLFTTPFQFLALWQDRLMARLERARAKVPEDRQQEAAPSIALPILMDLRFMEDENPLSELYLNLLARAIDKERCNEAHPAFVKIIEQMSPDEAMVMWQFREQDRWLMPPPIERGVWEGYFPILLLASPEGFWSSVEHLESLNLLRLPQTKLEPDGATFMLEPITKVVQREEYHIEVTKFGKWFVRACIPADFHVTKFNGDPANQAE